MNLLKTITNLLFPSFLQRGILGSIVGGLASGAVGSLLGGSGSSSGGKPREFLTHNNLFQTGFDRIKGPDAAMINAIGAIGALQNQSITDAGLFNQMAINNPDADRLRGLGQGFLGNLGAFDPTQIAAQQFGLINPILQEDFNLSNLDLENRLFAQGRLNSLGGSQQFNAQLDAQQDTQRKLLADSLGLGLAAQGQQANLGLQFLQADPQLRGLFQNLGSNSLLNALNIQQGAINQFNAGANAANRTSTPSGAFSPTQQIGAGLLNQGVEQITGAVGGLFQPSTGGSSFPSFNPFDASISFGGGR